MQVPPVNVILFSYMLRIVTSYMSRSLEGTRGVFCNALVLRKTSALSVIHCAGECNPDAQCVAYSQRGSQCLLHADFCSSDDLLPETGSFYAGKCRPFFVSEY